MNKQSRTKLKLGCLNVRGCNLHEKRCEIGDIMRDRDLDVLALSETKLKGRGEENFGTFKGVKSGVSERLRAREGVAIVLKDDLWRAVKEIKEVNARLMWVKLEIGKERWIIVSAYGPGSERSEEERESFWELLRECLGNFRESNCDGRSECQGRRHSKGWSIWCPWSTRGK